MNQQVHFKPAREAADTQPASRVLLTRGWRRNLPVGIAGGAALMVVAAVAQGVSFGFDKLSWFSLGVPFTLGMVATCLMLHLMQRSLAEQRTSLEREFRERTAELVETEKRFAEYGKVASEWYWETDTEDRLVFLSSRLYEASGVRPEDVLGRKRESLRSMPINEADREMWDHYRYCIENRLPFEDLRYASRTADGREIVYRSSGKPFYDDDGNFLGYRGTARDATGEVAEERRRQVDQALIYNATAVLNDGFFIFDADDRLMMCNQRFKDIYFEIADLLEPGVPYEKILHAIADSHIVFADEKEKQKWLEWTLENHANPTTSVEERLASGEWIRVVKQRMPDDYLVGLCIDITETKRIEEELAEAQRIARIGSFRWDALGDRPLSFSAEIANIYGRPLDEVMHLSDREFADLVIHPDDREPVLEAYSKSIEAGEAYNLEYRIIRPDGEVRHVIERAEVTAMRAGKVLEYLGMFQDVTEEKLTQREMEAAQGIANVGSFRWDLENSRMASYSREYLRILGRSRAEMDALGMYGMIEQIIHPDDQQRVQEIFEQSFNRDEFYEIEYRIRRPDGEIRRVIERCETSVWRDGKPVEQLGTIQDITDLRRSEQELEDAQRLARIGSFRWDVRQQRLISCSREFLEIIDQSREFVMGLRGDEYDEWVHADDRERLHAAYENIDETGEDMELEYRLQRPDGEIRHVIERISVSLWRDGKPAEELGTLQDITERRRFEHQLEEAQRIAGVGSFHYSLEQGRYLSVSPELQHLYGRTEEELLSNDDATLIELTVHPDDRERVTACYAEADKTGEEYRVEFRLLRSDGEVRRVVEHAEPLLSHSGKVVEQIGTMQDITDRRLSELQLEEAQRIAGVGSFHVKVKQEPISLSAEMARIYGRPIEELMELDDEALMKLTVHPDDQERVRKVYAESDDFGEDYEVEFRLVRPDGEIRKVVERGEVLRVHDGRTTELLGTLQDVTERQLIEQELEDAQRIARVGSFRWDVVNDRMISYTPEFARSYAHSIKGLREEPSAQYERGIHPDDLQRVLQAYELSNHSNDVVEVEYRVLREKGEIRHIIERLAPVAWRDGKIVEQIGTLQDVTELRQEEAMRRTSDQMLEAAIENVPGGFLLINPEGVIERFNRRFFDLYPKQQFFINEGVAFERFLNYGLDQGVYADALDDPEAWKQQRLQVGQSDNVEFIDRMSDGRSIQVAVRRLPNDNIVGMHVDVTELERAREAAEQANAAKSEFLASMSHELRTPMHGILSFAELGIKRIDSLSHEKLVQYLENIRDSGNRLLFLLNDLLDLSKLEAGKMSLDIAPLNLVDLVQSCINEQALRLRENQLVCELVGGDTGARCACDRNRIHQVISNVVSNAIKFSPEGGHIEIGLLRVENGYRVEVTDEGIGIPEDELDQIFDKFYQSARSRNHSGGTGLGLAICREIIDLHGGRIWAENNADQGSRIIFELPAASRPH